MRRLILALLAVSLLLAACGGGSSEEEDAIASRTPRGTEEAQQALEDFLGQPFIGEAQAEQVRDMVWEACAAFQEGGSWPEFEAAQVAISAEEGRVLSDFEISGMRSAAAMGLSAYCPQHEDKSP